MASTLILLSLQALAVIASPDFLAALRIHQKRQTPAQAESACSVVVGVASACDSLSPGWETMAPTDQAGCACYYADATTTAWIPDFFDGAVETCASFARTRDAEFYSLLQPFSNLCNDVGNINVPVTITYPAACTTVLDALDYCNTEIPGLSTLGATRSARCLCYGQTAWQPNGFDGPVATCAAFLKTAAPADYEILQPLNGFCSRVGDVYEPASTPASTTRSIPVRSSTTVFTPATTPDETTEIPTRTTPTVTSTATLAGYVTYPACSAVGSAIASCEVASPGFTTADPSSQAACICYTRSTSWVPDRFDTDVTDCADFVQTAEPADYSVFSELSGFCSQVGDIYAAAEVTTTGTRTGGGGINASGIMGGGGAEGGDTSSTSTARPTSTVTVPNPGAATPTSQTGGAMPTGAVDYWALKMISVVVIVQAFA